MKMATIIPHSMEERYYPYFRKAFEYDFPEIEVEYLFYDKYNEVSKMLTNRQKEFDAIIYSGSMAYSYAERELEQATVWCMIPKDGTAIYRALFSAMRKNYDVSRLSFDCFDEKVLKEVYQEIGYDVERLKIYNFDYNINHADYSQKVFEHHKQCYKNGLVSACVTRLSGVAELLEQEGIPHVHSTPTMDIFRETIALAEKLVLAKVNVKSQFVAFSIEISSSGTEIYEDVCGDYDYCVKRVKFLKCIYRYAEMVNGLVVEQGLRKFMIFAQKEIVEKNTKNIRDLQLLKWLVKETVNTVYIGIGYGEKPDTTYHQAELALRKCYKHKMSCAVISSEGNEMIIKIKTPGREGNESETLNKKWHKITDDTGLSIETIQKLSQLADHSQSDSFTANQIAKRLNISTRSAHRIMQRLEEQGYAMTVGKKMSNGKGRPSYVVQLLF